MLNLLVSAIISISVQAHFLMAQEVKFRVELTIPINPANRMAYVEWEGDGEQSTSGRASRQLDEYTDTTRHTFYIMLRPGIYYIRGRLLRNDGQHVSETKTVEIIGTVPH